VSGMVSRSSEPAAEYARPRRTAAKVLKMAFVLIIFQAARAQWFRVPCQLLETRPFGDRMNLTEFCIDESGQGLELLVEGLPVYRSIILRRHLGIRFETEGVGDIALDGIP